LFARLFVKISEHKVKVIGFVDVVALRHDIDGLIASMSEAHAIVMSNRDVQS
jgi:hypothetical protein